MRAFSLAGIVSDDVVTHFNLNYFGPAGLHFLMTCFHVLCSEACGRNANKVILYEDAAKKQLQEFISVLRGCELLVDAFSSLGVILENVESRQLVHLLTPGTSLKILILLQKIFWHLIC